jgi:hypothetical protein
MNVFHVPLSVEAPSRRMETVIRCLRFLPLDSTDTSKGVLNILNASVVSGAECAMHGAVSSCSQCSALARGRVQQSLACQHLPVGHAGIKPPGPSLLTEAIKSDVATPSTPLAPACVDRSPCPGLRISKSRQPGHAAYSRRCSDASADALHQRTTSAHWSMQLDQLNPQNSMGQHGMDDYLQVLGTPQGRPPPFTAAEGTFTSIQEPSGALPQPELLTGHSGAVLSLCLDDNGRMYSSSSDKTIRVRC